MPGVAVQEGVAENLPELPRQNTVAAEAKRGKPAGCGLLLVAADGENPDLKRGNDNHPSPGGGRMAKLAQIPPEIG